MFTESKDWDKIIYDRPENLKQPKYEEIELFDDNWRDIKLPQPPKNSSPECLQDFKRTKRESINVKEEQKEVRQEENRSRRGRRGGEQEKSRRRTGAEHAENRIKVGGEQDENRRKMGGELE